MYASTQSQEPPMNIRCRQSAEQTDAGSDYRQEPQQAKQEEFDASA